MSFLSKNPPLISRNRIRNTKFNGLTTIDYGLYPEQYIVRRNWSSVSTPNWKFLRADPTSQLPINPFGAYCTVRTDHAASVSCQKERYDFDKKEYVTFVYSESGTAQFIAPALSGALDILAWHNDCQDQARRIAIGKCLNKTRNMKINLAQAMGERLQSAHLLINSANRFISFARAFRRGRFGDCYHILASSQKKPVPGFPSKNLDKSPPKDKFGQLWLEYSYGWRPLLSDIYGAAQLLAETTLKYRPTRVAGTGGAADDTQKTYTTFEGATAEARWSVTSSAYAVFEFEVSNALLDTLKSTGITDPALLAWELLPYSFVLDWFVPVNNYLKQWQAGLGLDFKQGFVTTKTLIRGNASIVAGYPNGFGGGLSTPSGLGSLTASDYTVIMSRQPLTSFPSPAPLRWEPNLSPAKYVSGWALLNQIFGSKGGS